MQAAGGLVKPFLLSQPARSGPLDIGQRDLQVCVCSNEAIRTMSR